MAKRTKTTGPVCERCKKHEAMVGPVLLVCDVYRVGYQNVEFRLCPSCFDGLFKENEYGDIDKAYINKFVVIGAAGSRAFQNEDIGYVYPR